MYRRTVCTLPFERNCCAIVCESAERKSRAWKQTALVAPYAPFPETYFFFTHIYIDDDNIYYVESSDVCRARVCRGRCALTSAAASPHDGAGTRHACQNLGALIMLIQEGGKRYGKGAPLGKSPPLARSSFSQRGLSH